MFKKPVTTYQRELRRRCLVFFSIIFMTFLTVFVFLIIGMGL